MNTKLDMRVLTALLLCSFLWGCGDLTSGGVGEVEVWTTAEDPQGSASSSPPSSHAVVPVHSGPGASGSPAAQASEQSAAAGGTLTAQLRAYVRADLTGEWIEITEGVRDMTLQLDGSREGRAGVRFLDSGRYSGFRVVFQRVEANVTSGLVVAGIPILGLVRVDLGTQSTLTVERSITLDVEARGAQDIVLDLSANTWLPQLSLTTLIVPTAAFQTAVGVRVR